jgi:cyclopropane-fatty-acyl-phospholipid synthase
MATLLEAPPSTARPARGPVHDFLALLFPAPREFDVHVGGDIVVGSPFEPEFTLAFADAGALRRAFRPPIELSLGEAYVRGDLDIDGDLRAGYAAMRRVIEGPWSNARVRALTRAWLRLPRAHHARWGAGRAPARLRTRDARERDRRAIQYHYDVGNDFFRLWLGRELCYSSAYFPKGTEDLDTAQERKLEHICRKLRLHPGERLLDIGCGWGALILHAAEKHGVQATGITVSQAQYDVVRERIRERGLGERVRVELCDYRDVGGGPYDKAASIGMFEHVGAEHLEEYFARIRSLLRPGGLFLNHGISRWPPPSPTRTLAARATDRWLLGRRLFTLRYFFPNGETLPLSQVNDVAERCGFEVRDVENLREHYARTLRLWVAGLEREREAAVRAAGESAYRLWRIYFTASAHSFETGAAGVHQTLLAVPDGGRVELPASRVDLYR